MSKKTIDAAKFCKVTQVDIENIYLGPSKILTHCLCPPPPLFPDPDPIDEGYLNDSRYISDKDRKLYEKEFEELIKNREMENKLYYDYRPQKFEENKYDNFEDDISVEQSDEDEEEDIYDDEDDFEIVRK